MSSKKTDFSKEQQSLEGLSVFLEKQMWQKFTSGPWVRWRTFWT